MSKLISSLKWANTKIEPSDVLHIYDVFNLDRLNFYLKAGQPKYVVSDHWATVDLPGQTVHCAPLWLTDQLELFNHVTFDDPTTLHTFNFMINKKQVNRHLCLKLVELFKLTDYDYTWSGITSDFDMSDIINELNLLEDSSPVNSAQRSFMLTPVDIKPKFIEFPGNSFGTYAVINYGGNRWTWDNGLAKLFLTSAISLITESVKFEKGAVFTEKTAYSVLGLSLPIWIGGYQQATQWKHMGFDIFEDIIDHSYQNYSTLFERCYYAFADNIELLTNKERTKKLRLELMPRLEKNRNLLLNHQLTRYCKQEISTWPIDLQTHIPEILKFFPRINVDLNL